MTQTNRAICSNLNRAKSAFSTTRRHLRVWRMPMWSRTTWLSWRNRASTSTLRPTITSSNMSTGWMTQSSRLSSPKKKADYMTQSATSSVAAVKRNSTRKRRSRSCSANSVYKSTAPSVGISKESFLRASPNPKKRETAAKFVTTSSSSMTCWKTSTCRLRPRPTSCWESRACNLK